MSEHLHVITGGPGSGKTSLIEALAADGFAHMPEAGRAIIQDQVEIGGRALPWVDQAQFAASMLTWELRSYREAVGARSSVIFDRAIPDVIGYLRLCGLPVEYHVIRAAEQRRYATKVFFAPPWQAIFTQDTERRQTFDEANATFDIMLATYSGLGYQIIYLPLAPVPERVAFLRAEINR